MPKTLLLTHFFPPSVGGIEEYYHHVAEHYRAGDVVVLTAHDPAAQPQANVLRENLFPGSFPPRWLPWLWKFPRLLKEHAIEVLWIGHISPLTPLAWLTARRKRLRIVVSVHGVDLIVPERHIVSRWISHYILRHADTVIANSTFMAGALRARGVADERIVVIPPGVDMVAPLEHASRQQLRATLGVADRWVILTVARFVVRKGIDRVVSAVSRLSQRFPNLYLVLIGDGPERKHLEQRVNEQGITKHVSFLGQVPPKSQQKRDWFHAADAFVLTTRAAEQGKDIESYGIVYREAQAAGLPVIASALGGATEIVHDQHDGFLVPEADEHALDQALETLITDPERAQSLGTAGREEAARHTWEQRWPLLDRVLGVQSDMAQPLVSVIIPCWNVADLVQATLDSIAAQTYTNIEIITVDDGSTDDTKAVLEKNSRVRVLAQENRGAAAARNTGARTAQGTYLLFCDADVTLAPNAIEEFVRLLELHPDRAFAYSAFRLGWRTFHRLEFDPALLRKHNFINTVSLVRASAFPGFDETLPRYQDWDLWLTIVEHGGAGIGTAQYLFQTTSRVGITRSAGSLPHRDLVERVIGTREDKQGSRHRDALERFRHKHPLS